jgi:hypothetical protein
MEKTIAQQLGITIFPFEIKDSFGDVVYTEYANGSWDKTLYNESRKVVSFFSWRRPSKKVGWVFEETRMSYNKKGQRIKTESFVDGVLRSWEKFKFDKYGIESVEEMSDDLAQHLERYKQEKGISD